MSVSNADATRIKELPHRPFNDSVENKARRILKELPHLAAQNIAQVATDLVAEAEAATQIADMRSSRTKDVPCPLILPPKFSCHF